VHSGKVRDLFRTDDGRLVMVASDRISAFDYVLASTIPDKGRILTAMTAWWFGQLDGVVGNHLLALDDPLLPDVWRGRAMVCTPLEMVPVEAVARGYLTGSGLLDYRATGEVCGVPLPPGLVDGDRLPEPIFTPATKAALGEHDENVSYGAVVASVGAATATRLRELTLQIYGRAAELARSRGIILADTKFEFGRDPATGT
jgi:phosphoribosylaminoimidazole-succinocarboxamide synthase